MNTRFYSVVIFICWACFSDLFAQEGGPPMHMFFEYGPVNKNIIGSLSTKNNRHYAVGLKLHHWKEEKPFQLVMDMDYRNILIHNDSNEAITLGLGELYMGSCLLISSTKPWFPTASALVGGYIGSTGGFNALLSAGIYYSFTPPNAKPSGVSLEITYRAATINYNSYKIPPAFALRFGVFF